ncbi:hypothetical protein ACP4OV_001109 [Aristida adscensionis]
MRRAREDKGRGREMELHLLRRGMAEPVRAKQILHALQQTISLDDGSRFNIGHMERAGGGNGERVTDCGGSIGKHGAWISKAGDILFLHMSKDPIRTGEIVVFDVDGRDIPIVHRVIKVHERRDSAEVDILTKGDNNPGDDRMLYAQGQYWLQQHHIVGRAAGYLPYVGWFTLAMTEIPLLKYALIGALGLLVITT